MDKTSKDKAITAYIRGKITISEVRRILQKIEGRRLIKLYDRK